MRRRPRRCIRRPRRRPIASREHPILADRHLVAAQRQAAGPQHHHLRTCIAVPKHLARPVGRGGGYCAYNAGMPISFLFGCPLVARVLPVLLSATTLMLSVTLAAHAEDWPEYRGKGRRGVWTETGVVGALPADGLKVRWRTPIDAGWSSPVVSGGRVFLTDFTRAENSTDVVERAICLDEETGRILWTHTWEADYRTVGATWEGPRVTPTVDGDRVWFVGATGKLLSMDVESGAVVWTGT